jgi:hypothetical protein
MHTSAPPRAALAAATKADTDASLDSAARGGKAAAAARRLVLQNP